MYLDIIIHDILYAENEDVTYIRIEGNAFMIFLLCNYRIYPIETCHMMESEKRKDKKIVVWRTMPRIR